MEAINYSNMNDKDSRCCRCEKWCVLRWFCIIFWLLAFGGGGTGLGFYIGKKFQGNCKAAEIKCGDNIPGNSTLWYNGERDFDFFGSTEKYMYTMNFVPNATIPYNHTTIILGTFYSCVQVTGKTAAEKHNCTFNYAYETGTCEMQFMNGWCDVSWAIDQTDNHLQYLIYNGQNDSFNVGFFSHGPSGGNIDFEPSDTPLITCDPATDSVPFSYPLAN